MDAQSRASTSRHLLNPLTSPGGRLERICEILRLVHNLTVTKLHNAYGVCWLPLVSDCVFGDPEITVAEHSPDIEA